MEEQASRLLVLHTLSNKTGRTPVPLIKSTPDILIDVFISVVDLHVKAGKVLHRMAYSGIIHALASVAST